MSFVPDPLTAVTARPIRIAYERLAPLLAAAMTFVAIVAPMGMAWLLPLLAAAVPLAFPKGHLRDHLRLCAIMVFGGLLAVDALLSTIWSDDKPATLTAASLFTLYLSCAWLACCGTLVETEEVIERLSKAAILAVFAGAAFLIFEFLTHSYLERTLFTYVPILRPSSPEHVGLLNGRVAFLAPDELNRGVGVLNVLLWPALLLMAAEEAIARRPRRAAIALAFLSTAATFLSPHATSQIAIVCAALIFLLHSLNPAVARALVLSGWIAAVMLVLPAVHVAYKANLHTVDWLAENGRARIIIWEATAERYLEARLLGIGAGSTKGHHTAGEGAAASLRGQTGAHAHNLYLQTWYELGFLGALALLATGLAVLGWIFRLPAYSQGYVLSTFSSAAVISAFSWGMWQPWYMASWFYCAVLAGLATRRAADRLRGASTQSTIQ